MPEYTLEELHKRSLPALHNAELTLLAGNEQLSPSKVYEIAAKSYSERLAKAARFLAIVRRDYGTGVFKALVNNGTIEPAPRMEHVQENTMQKTQNAALSRIKNPKTRIEIMINLGLKTELEQEIMSLPSSWELYFEGESGNMLFAKSELLAYDKDNTNPLYHFALVIRDPETFGDVDYDSHRSHPATRIHLPGFFKLMQWDKDKTAEFVRYVLLKVTAHDPYKLHSSVDTAALEIAKQFLEPQTQLFRDVQLWYVRFKFSSGRVFEMRTCYLKNLDLGLPLPKGKVPVEAELDTTVDYMLKLGMSISDIRQDFLRVINAYASNCQPEFMLAFMAAECFENGDPDRERVLVDGYLNLMWKEYVRSGSHGPDQKWLGYYCKFLKYISPSFRFDESRINFYFDEFIDWVSHGYVNGVIKALIYLGGTLGTMDFTEKTIPLLLPAAFTKAMEDGRCGAAVALYNKYGDQCFGSRQSGSAEAKQKMFNMIVDLLRYAKSLGQSTTLQ